MYGDKDADKEREIAFYISGRRVVNPGGPVRVVNFLEGGVKNFAHQMCARAHQISAGGGVVSPGRPVVKLLEGGVREFTHQMCAGARQMSLGRGVVSPGGTVVKFLEGVVN
jgi:hypothetical protein